MSIQSINIYVYDVYNNDDYLNVVEQSEAVVYICIKYTKLEFDEQSIHTHTVVVYNILIEIANLRMMAAMMILAKQHIVHVP